jgi:uncharacterized protein YndB with AHSA1/START domain
MRDVIDYADEIDAVHREVGPEPTEPGRGRTVLLRRVYGNEVKDVWDACTNPERISGWLLPATGDLRVGGAFRLEGSAHGTILRCEPLRMFRLTWAYGRGAADFGGSEVEVRLTDGGDGRTVFELEQTTAYDRDTWDEFGPGLSGVGWDLLVLELTLHLRGEVRDATPSPWQVSPDAARFIERSSRAWGVANEDAGASPADAATAMHNTTSFYAP